MQIQDAFSDTRTGSKGAGRAVSDPRRVLSIQFSSRQLSATRTRSRLAVVSAGASERRVFETGVATMKGGSTASVPQSSGTTGGR